MKLPIIAVSALAALAASAAPAGAAAPPDCVTVYDFPDAGLTYCYDVDSSCMVTEHRTTFIGSESRCVVRSPFY